MACKVEFILQREMQIGNAPCCTVLTTINSFSSKPTGWHKNIYSDVRVENSGNGPVSPVYPFQVERGLREIRDLS